MTIVITVFFGFYDFLLCCLVKFILLFKSVCVLHKYKYVHARTHIGAHRATG